MDWGRDRGRFSKMGRTKMKGRGKCKDSKDSSSERGSVREGTGAGTKAYAGRE